MTSLATTPPIEIVEVVREPGAADPVRRARLRTYLERTLAIAVPLVGLALWQVASSRRWIEPRLYPSPTTILDEGWNLLVDGRLRTDITATLYRVLIGYVIGSLTGLVVGTFMGVSRLFRAALEPTLNAFYVVPKLALLPIFLAILGYGEAPKLALVAVTVFFFVWIETMEAMASVPAGFREAARAFDVSAPQMFGHVLLPAALPQIFVALRVSMGVAVLVNTAAEFVVGNDGLGYLIFNSRALFAVERMFVGIAVVAIVGVVLSSVVGVVGRWLTPWHDHGPRRQRRGRGSRETGSSRPTGGTPS